ncbi:bifunctional DNA-formamidopyrimidine glycosylase/DNA-(apurinic or apyrimidinic site) lyase [Alphaproteobacteria bacterium]|nr:bifunctional DNA-formamidopyrimidine glycosylase/DNA-(apurinic or apyrimidinic site) lyase [Alphaproteobacteria bacterium]
MPELPEVETTIRYLRSKVKEKKIIKLFKSDKKLRKNLTNSDISHINNKKIIDVRRIAKYIIIELSSKRYLVIHLGMSGRLKYLPLGYKIEKHDHLIITFNNFLIIYNDPRRFGMTFLLSDLGALDVFFNHYGFDPLKDKISLPTLFKVLLKKNITIKQMLLDQRYFVGIGNIYANEILFLSKISPKRAVNRITYQEFVYLVKNIKLILKIAIKNGGSSINDYKAPDGVLGNFQNLFKVYQKDKITLKGKTHIIKKIIQNNRSTFYCPTLQN